MANKTRSSLERLSRSATRYGFTIVHPINRFILFLTSAGFPRRVSQALGAAKMLPFLDAIIHGDFDGIGGLDGSVAEKEKEERNRKCELIKLEIDTIVRYED